MGKGAPGGLGAAFHQKLSTTMRRNVRVSMDGIAVPSRSSAEVSGLHSVGCFIPLPGACGEHAW